MNYRLEFKEKGDIMKASKSTILKAIMAKCSDCCCGDKKEIKLCTIPKCALFPYRLGKAEIEVTEADKKTRKPRGPMSESHKAALKAGRDLAKANKTK